MTIKEMFKKIETYNEVAEMVKGEKLTIHITLDISGEYFEDYKSFKKYAKENYAESLIIALTEYKDFTFGETHEIAFNCYGWDMIENVEINAFNRW